MHEFNPWFNDQSFTHTALSTHTHQAASRANVATCTWTSARGIIRVTTGLAPFIAIEAKPYCVVLFKKAHLIEARSIVEESSHDAEVLGRRDAELDGGLGYEIGTDGSLFAREIDTNQGKTRVLPNAADLDPSTHCGPKLGRDSP